MNADTETKARTKWCPLARISVGYGEGHSANRWKQSAPPEEPWALNPVPCRCIASDCAMWRWGEKRNPNWKPNTNFMSGVEHPDEIEPTHIVDTKRGYCGLAGRPTP